MSYKEIALPNVITNIEVDTIRTLAIAINYADGSIKKTRIKESDDLDIKFVKDGSLIEITGLLVKIVGTDEFSLVVDYSTVNNSNKVNIPLCNIRELLNLSDLSLNSYIPAPDLNVNPPVAGQDEWEVI